MSSRQYQRFTSSALPNKKLCESVQIRNMCYQVSYFLWTIICQRTQIGYIAGWFYSTFPMHTTLLVHWSNLEYQICLQCASQNLQVMSHTKFSRLPNDKFATSARHASVGHMCSPSSMYCFTFLTPTPMPKKLVGTLSHACMLWDGFHL